MSRLNFYLYFYIFYFSSFFVNAQAPQYYSSINFDLQGGALMEELSDLIIETHHNFIPYTSGYTDTWDIIRVSDLSYNNSGEVLLIYGYDDDDGEYISDRTRDIYDTCHTSSCIGLWNREHVFARSLADPSLTTFEPGPGTDVHNLRAADSQKNSQRSNRLFTYGSGDSQIIDEYFYPGDEWKGDVARIIMYMYLRYPGQCEALNSGASSTNYSPENDMPDVFLDWNAEDPVSDLERTRNDVIYSFQGNRNPFIDNPYLATLIWNGPQAEDTWSLLSLDSIETTKIFIYPSITDNSIKIGGLQSDTFKATIYNQLGQTVLKSQNNRSINVTRLSPGLYILKLSQLDNTTSIKFIID